MAAAVQMVVSAMLVAGAAIPDKTVVLTFDDAVKSHRTVVAPLLQEHGFGATFFVTHCWMADAEHFMSWADIAELHGMGFEIGNHSWTHPGFGNPAVGARMEAELALVEYELRKVGVPKPISFAWTGNGFGPEARAALARSGYILARRGMQPEVPYGTLELGPLYDPALHDPLLIPSAGDAYPNWTLDHFKTVVDRARDGKIAVVQFHGVPDEAHPWVHTPPERFREYMQYLKDGGFNVIALRDVMAYLPETLPKDPMARVRYGGMQEGVVSMPAEVAATREDLPFWLDAMLGAHGYSFEEAGLVAGMRPEDVEARWSALGGGAPAWAGKRLGLLPYPGGRHPRIGFLDGAVKPERGTKVSLFLPWDGGGYIVADLPEAVFSNLGLTFLAHTHIPTIWDAQNIVQSNVDWTRLSDGSLTFERTLPNGIVIGATAAVTGSDEAALEVWLENGTDEPLTGLRTQVCVMLKGAPGFTRLSNEGKAFKAPYALAQSDDGARWIGVAFERCGRSWGNDRVPCIHADPVLPDAAPGERVQVRGVVKCGEGEMPPALLETWAAQYPPLDAK